MWYPCAKSTPYSLQHLDGPLVADEFGDGALAEPARDVTIACTVSWSGGARRQRLDEVAVDLDDVERQVLEVVERAEAGAEVVERELAAEARRAARESTRARSMLTIAAVSVTSKIRQVGSIAGAAHRLGDEVDHRRVADRRRPRG